jgi:hypothetical protein
MPAPLTTTPIDLIGDIHGHADELDALLKKLGYARRNGSYAHPERTVFFVGDYIDRGPKIRETLDIVRRMVEAGQAIALMGNHEYNALCYHTPDGKGGYLRAHTEKNDHQHAETLRQFACATESILPWIDWFRTLPLFLETDTFRVVHACWDAQHIATLRARLVNDRLTEALLHEAAAPGSALYTAVEETLKGKEVRLPAGHTFKDKQGTPREELRVKWWVDPVGATYRELGFPPHEDLPDYPVDVAHFGGRPHYFADEVPVFFGHYWLQHEPMLQRENICCLDYSVAKEGRLVAYRFDGELKLDAGKLVCV